MVKKKTLGKWQIFFASVFVISLTFNIFVVFIDFLTAYELPFNTAMLNGIFTFSGFVALIWWAMIWTWRKQK